MSEVDRRAELRRELSKAATIQSKDGSFKSTCLIHNASKAGCQIIMHSTTDVPDNVKLFFDGLTAPLEGFIVWRQKNRLGVKFDQ